MVHGVRSPSQGRSHYVADGPLPASSQKQLSRTASERAAECSKFVDAALMIPSGRGAGDLDGPQLESMSHENVHKRDHVAAAGRLGDGVTAVLVSRSVGVTR